MEMFRSGYFDHLAALGRTLLHFLWQGSLIAMLFAIADRATRRKAAAVRYGVALGMFALMPIVVLGTLVHEIYSEPVAHTDSGGSQASSAATSPAPIHFTVGSEVQTKSHENLLLMVDLLWLSGTLTLLARSGHSYLQLRAVIRQATLDVPASIESAFSLAKARVYASGTVMLKVSENVVTPFTAGVFRRVVIAPVSALLSLSPEEMALIFAHELAHIRRWDYAVNLIQVLVETTLFFHPGVWWISRNVREQREVSCDDVAASLNSPLRYATALLRLEESRAPHQFAMPLQGHGGPLYQRVESLLNGTSVYRMPTSSGSATAISTLVIALLLASTHSNVSAVQSGFTTAVRKTHEAIAPQIKRSQQVVAHHPTVTTNASAQHVKVTPRVRGRESNDEAIQSSLPDRTPEDPYVAELRRNGLALFTTEDLKNVAALKALNVTPEYVRGILQSGIPRPTVKDLVAMRVLHVTPEFALQAVRDGTAPDTARELVATKAYKVDRMYAQKLLELGYPPETGTQLLHTRESGATAAYAEWFKGRFPRSTLEDLRASATVHLSEDDVRQAAARGVAEEDLQSILALKKSSDTKKN